MPLQTLEEPCFFCFWARVERIPCAICNQSDSGHLRVPPSLSLPLWALSARHVGLENEANHKKSRDGMRVEREQDDCEKEVDAGEGPHRSTQLIAPIPPNDITRSRSQNTRSQNRPRPVCGVLQWSCHLAPKGKQKITSGSGKSECTSHGHDLRAPFPFTSSM